MGLFDKSIGKEERKSLEFAEDAREADWKYSSFVALLFQGKVKWDLISPFPKQPEDDRAIGNKLLGELETFLKANLNPDKVDETREIPKHVINGLIDMGAFAMKIPKEYGGLGLSQINYDRALHLLGSYCGSTTALLSAHQSIGVPQPLLDFGTEEQKRKYLPRFRKGAISAFALTEVDVGSDPRSMKTKAVPTEDGKYFILNGEKLWCTNGNIAEVIVVMAKTPSKIVNGKEKEQITAFIVETASDGFEVSYRCKFMGLNAIQNGILKFHNVRVPRENIILGEGQGLKLALVTLNTGRLSLPAAVTGMSKWALLVSRKWARERNQWGSSIGKHESISSKLSYMAATTFAMDGISNLTAYMADNKRFDIRLEAAAAKLFCTEEAWTCVNHAVQIRGGRGYETGPSLEGRGEKNIPLERAMRDSRVNTIFEGSSEIIHLFIAREAIDFHLKKLAVLFTPKGSVFYMMKELIKAGFYYSFWYPSLWLSVFSGGKFIREKKLKKHARFIKKASKILARGMFHKMMIYQRKFALKQNLINRFVDIGVDLFAMAVALSHAEYMAKNDPERKNSCDLAHIFCCNTARRVKARFEEISRNEDYQSYKLAKKILADEFAWLENDIMK